MKINLDYKMSDKYREGGNIKLNQELTANFINFAVSSKYKDGLKSGGQRRLYSRLQRNLDEAIEKNVDEIELEQAQKDFLTDVFASEIPVSPYEAKYFVVLEDEINSLLKEPVEVEKE